MLSITDELSCYSNDHKYIVNKHGDGQLRKPGPTLVYQILRSFLPFVPCALHLIYESAIVGVAHSVFLPCEEKGWAAIPVSAKAGHLGMTAARSFSFQFDRTVRWRRRMKGSKKRTQRRFTKRFANRVISGGYVAPALLITLNWQPECLASFPGLKGTRGVNRERARDLLRYPSESSRDKLSVQEPFEFDVSLARHGTMCKEDSVIPTLPTICPVQFIEPEVPFNGPRPRQVNELLRFAS